MKKRFDEDDDEFEELLNEENSDFEDDEFYADDESVYDRNLEKHEDASIEAAIASHNDRQSGDNSRNERRSGADSHNERRSGDNSHNDRLSGGNSRKDHRNSGNRRAADSNQLFKLALIGIAVLVCIIVGLVIALLHKNGNGADEGDLLVTVEASIDAGAENLNLEDASNQEGLDSINAANSDNSEDAASAASSAETGSNSEDSDPEASVSKAQGETIDVTSLKNASNAGENTNITYGIDVSRFQGTINWQKVAESGVDFAMIRVGFRDSKTGEIKADTNARYNMQEAEEYGIKIGAYFFSTAISREEAIEEANWVASYISQYPITYPVGFNCEGFEKESSRQYNLTKDDRSAIAAAFLDQIYAAGYTPIFYASQAELAGDAQWNTSQLQQKYKIWMAWYNQDSSALSTGPAYDGQCAMWQYTSHASVPGIEGAVDVDVAYFGYNGTETAKDTSERETASADVEALMKFDPVDETVTAKSSTNLRDKPSQGSDSTVMVTLENGQIAQRTGVSASGWSRVVYEGKTYYAVSSYLTTNLNAPKQETAQQPSDNSGFKTKFVDCNDIVTAKEVVNLRNKPSVTDEDSQVIATLTAGETCTRTGMNAEFGWSRVEYNGQTLYCVTSYLRTVE